MTTLAAFTTAVAGTTAAVIYVNGKLAAGRVGIGSNKTIVGVCGAELHGHISVRLDNVIVRNIKIVGYGVGNCALDPSYDSAVGCSSGDDAVTVQRRAPRLVRSLRRLRRHRRQPRHQQRRRLRHHLLDEVPLHAAHRHRRQRLDGRRGPPLLEPDRRADNVAADVGHLNVTWHHNWWADNVNQRMPRSRRGKIHIFNNLFTATGNSYCTTRDRTPSCWSRATSTTA